MDIRKPVNLALLLLVILLAYLADKTVEDSQSVLPPLVKRPSGPVSFIQIVRNSGERIAFSRTNNRWEMTYPVKIAANPVRIQQLLQVSTLPSRARYDEDPADLERYGLLTPAAILTFDNQNIAIGNSHALKPMRYVWYENSLHLLDDTYLQLTGVNAGEFVDKQLTAEHLDLTGVLLPGISMSNTRDGHWTSAPQLISPAAISDSIQWWQSARADKVTYYSGIRTARHSITLDYSGNPSIEFKLIRAQPLLLARSDLNLLYSFDSATTAGNGLQFSSYLSDYSESFTKNDSDPTKHP